MYGRIAGILASFCALTVCAGEIPPGGMPLPRCAPASVGVPAAAVRDFRDALGKIDNIHSYMVLRRGKVVAEGWRAPYRPEYRHMLFSTSKSFTSAAVGIAAAEGLLALDDPIVKFFPEYLDDKVSERMRSVTVRDLLTMTSGHANCYLMSVFFRYKLLSRMGAALGGGRPAELSAPRGMGADMVKGFLRSELPFPPGGKFVYDTGASYMLAAIVRKACGRNPGEFLNDCLFRPLGIDGYRWDNSPEGINWGGFGLYLRTEDLAKFALLLLQNGVWEGKSVIPAAYVRDATRKHVETKDFVEQLARMFSMPDGNPQSSGGRLENWSHGYGYQFWMGRDGIFRCDGHLGQFAVMAPKQEFAVVVTADTMQFREVLRAVDTLRKAVTDKTPPGGSPTAVEDIASLPPLVGKGGENFPVADGRYRLDKNSLGWETLAVVTAEDGSRRITIEPAALGGGFCLHCSAGCLPSAGFHDGELFLNPLFGRQKIAVRSRMEGEGGINSDIFWRETPFHIVLRLRFAADKVTINYQVPKKYAPFLDAEPEFSGKMEK